jgi:hypothetical protein
MWIYKKMGALRHGQARHHSTNKEA